MTEADVFAATHRAIREGRSLRMHPADIMRLALEVGCFDKAVSALVSDLDITVCGVDVQYDSTVPLGQVLLDD